MQCNAMQMIESNQVLFPTKTFGHLPGTHFKYSPLTLLTLSNSYIYIYINNDPILCRY